MPKKPKRVVATMEFNSTVSATKIKAALKQLVLNIDGEEPISPKQVQVNAIKDESAPAVSL